MRDIDGNFILTFAPSQHIQAILESQVLLDEQAFLESKLNIKSLAFFKCFNYNIIGAHRVLEPNKVHARLGDTFYLVSICNGCNHTTQPIVFNHDVKAVFWVAQ